MSRPYVTGNSRDDQISGQPARGHVARFTVVPRRGFVCVKCAAPVDTCELFCRLHLWTFDNPVLRDAAIFAVSPMLLERSARYPGETAPP